MGVDFPNRPTFVFVGCQHPQLELGVGRHEARHFSTGIAAGTRNRHSLHCHTLNQRWKVVIREDSRQND